MHDTGTWNLLGRTRPRLVTPGVHIVDHRCTDLACQRATTPPGGAATLAFVRHGVAELFPDGRRAVADPSQLVWMDSATSWRIRHRGCLGGPCATTLHLDEALLSRPGGSRNGADWSAVGVPLLSPSSELAYTLHVILAVTRGRTTPSPEACDLAMASVQRAFAATLEESLRPAVGPPSSCFALSELARRGREILATRATQGISLAQVAEEIGCTRHHLCRVFKAEVGLTTGQYLHRVRIGEALHRLGDGEVDLSALAADLGFSSHSHFTSVFRRLVGMPPSLVLGRRLAA